MPSVKFVNLGCPKNLVDSERMAGILKNAGYEIVDNQNSADNIIINTCSFIEDARKEAVETMLDGIRWKEETTGRRIFVMGCLPQRYPDELEKEIPEVDGFFGVGDFEGLFSRMNRDRKKADKNLLSDTRLYSFTPKHYHYLRIADGCDNRCTFCAIPDIRGSYKSRPPEEIVREAIELVEDGAKELIITAQEITGYGVDLKGEENLVKLLERLSEESGAGWIRLMYLHPPKLSDELIELAAGENSILPYFDLPIEHISDNVLGRMGRRITRAEIESKLIKIRNKLGECAIRTSLIVGFPGETESDFSELLEFVEQGWFDRLGVFGYSPEEGTPAYKFKNTISSEEAEFRKDTIMEIQSEISLKNNEGKIGQIIDTIVDEIDENKIIIGRTVFDAPDVDGNVYFKGDCAPGDLVKVKITGADEYDLFGVLT